MSFKAFRKFWALFLLLVLVGCAQLPIYHDLTESDANEILVALQDRGIEAQKVREEKSQQVSWSIHVAKKDAASARKILVENNLPRKRQLGSEICKKDVLIPTPEQEKCKKILAKQGDIVNLLESIEGVISAEVALNMPEVSEFSTETQSSKKPTASAVLRVRKTPEGLELTEPKIQRHISSAVENLDPRDISVVITYVQPPPEVGTKQPSSKKWVSIAGLKMDPDSKDDFKIYALVVLIFLIGISVALVFSLLKMTKLRRQLRVFRMGGISGGPEPRMIQAPEAGGVAPQIPAAGQTAPKA